MRFCGQCGSEAEVDDAFCRTCGRPLTEEGGPSSPSQPGEATQQLPHQAGMARPAAQPGRPTTTTATSEMVGRTCPYCRFPLKESGAVVECGACHTVHHAECWRENGGCAVPGCAGAPAQTATSQTAVLPIGAAAPPVAPTTAAGFAPGGPAAPVPGGRALSPPLIVAIVAVVLGLGAVAGVLIAVTSGNGSSNNTADRGLAPTTEETSTTETSTTESQETQTSTETSSVGTTAAAAQPLPLQAVDGARFSIEVPSGWSEVESETPKQGYVQSKWQDPSGAGDYLLIDMSTVSATNQDSLEQMAAPVHSDLEREHGYGQVSYGGAELGTMESWQWVFTLPGVERVDWFFRECEDGFAVLGSTSPDRYETLLPTFTAVAASVKASGC